MGREDKGEENKKGDGERELDRRNSDSLFQFS